MLKVPAQISKVETTSDKCLKLIVHTTQELAPSSEAEVFQMKQKIGWFVFSDVSIEESDIPDEPIEFEGQKTLSERLRNVLFRLHEKQASKPEEFEFYRQRIMEKLINSYKAK
jgi:hypothetical protein